MLRDERIGIGRDALADTARAPPPGLGVSGENAMDLRAQTQIRKAHDSGRYLRGDTGRTGGALCLLHRESGLADRAHSLGPVGKVSGTALYEYGGNDIVSALQIRSEILDEVRIVRPVPQVVMRIADRAVRLEGRLARKAQPFRSRESLTSDRHGCCSARLLDFDQRR
ncbi:MAG: hypothetical protein OXC10_14305 [Rhodospirillaceae bacterium]|nr:hypothetical protein [Rhodospirillaceae bacterium]